jgi:hypothetical protein
VLRPNPTAIPLGGAVTTWGLLSEPLLAMNPVSPV